VLKQATTVYVMKTFVRQHKGLAILVPIAAVVVAWNIFMDLRPGASVRGHRDAISDVAHGRYKELGLDLGDAPELPEYARLLQGRYQIKFKIVGDCYVSFEDVAYMDAYNDVSIPAAKGRFGHDVFAECKRDAMIQLNVPLSSKRRQFLPCL